MCVHCGDEGVLDVTDDRDAEYVSPCHACPAGVAWTGAFRVLQDEGIEI